MVCIQRQPADLVGFWRQSPIGVPARHSRASSVWAVCLRSDADQPGSLPPPSAPCSSAPFGRAGAQGVTAVSMTW